MASYGSIKVVNFDKEGNNENNETNPLLSPIDNNNTTTTATTTTNTPTTHTIPSSDPAPFIVGRSPLNPLSALTFQWIEPLLEKGNTKDQLDPSDLKSIPLPPTCTTNHVMCVFGNYWSKDLERAAESTSTSTSTGKKKKKFEPSLAWCLTKSFINDYIKAGLLKLIHDVNVFVGPIVLHALIEYLRQPNDGGSPHIISIIGTNIKIDIGPTSLNHGLLLTASVTISQIIMSFCLRHYFYKCYLTGLRMRTAVVMAVYQKSLVLSSGERQSRTSGEIINLMTIDAQRIQDFTTYGHAIWYSVLQIGLAIYFLWQQLGPSCLGGVAVILIMVPVNKFIASWMGRLQKALMKARDDRVDVNNEVLGSMKVIKLQAWEGSFKKRIMELRNVELTMLRNYVLANCFSIMMWTAVPLLVALATFTAYTLSGNELDVASALTALALFDILRFPLFMLPNVINNIVESSISLNRVRTFLLGEEYKPIGGGDIQSDAGVNINRGTFIYDSKKPKILISDDGTGNHNVKDPNEKQHLQEMHDKNWEITLLKAQLADVESRLMHVANENMKKDTSLVEEVSVPLTGGDEKETKNDESQEHHEEESLENLLALRRVNFECNRGELIAVVGSVGSGKSTFINSILGEVRSLAGTIAVKGRLAYCPQLPFIMNDTVKRNIMFGRQNEGFNKKRYDLSISSCALEHDLQMLGDGDQTEIGEKGITLSGGQKARIGMARAVYHDADIYLLDDPLAAVDAHVGKHLFQECIVNELLLNKSGSSSESQKKSSIILVTNAIQYLSDPNVDKIVVLDNGSIAEVGNYKELSENPDSLFSSFLSVVLDTGAHSHASENEDEEEEESSTDSDKESFDDKSLGSNVWEGFLSKFSPKKPIEPMPDKSKKNHVIDGESYQNIVSKVPTSPKKRRISKKASFKEKKSDKLSSSVKSVDKAPPPTTPLMTSELGEREKGQVTSEVYLTWAKAAGGTLVGIVVILAYIVDQGIGVASKWWLTYWSRNGGGSPSAAREFLLVYAIINLTSIVSMFGRVVFLMFSGLRASRKLFTELLEVVLQAPMSFFDTTPAGRIINRFSKDIFTIDEKLVATMRSYFATLFNVFGVIIVISYVSPYFIICLVPLLAFYLQQQKFFTKTYRELKRLDSVNRSPLYALLGETLDGVSTIRAYNAEPTLVSRIISMLDEQQNAYFLTCTAQCWLAVRLELVGSLIICSACLLAVYQHLSIGGNETFAGLAGLSISFALSVTQSLNWTVRMSSDLEAHMVSVERVRQYCQLPTEARHHLPSDKSLLYSWPSDGKIVFSSAKLRYRPGLPLVLKGLDIEIPPMSKIGVVGRTGAGIVELSSGTISIDGIDISKVGLNLLRSKIAVIPQDPVLFSGSIRSNLDPFHEYGDERLFEVLERVGLTTNGTIQKSQSSNSLRSDVSLSASTPNAVKSLSDEVLEGGFNYSVGQRQLLVIARSLLRGAKIVIMDEATASVDADTDARIQRVMRTEFKDSTCITVAHRINTILDSDYILVMDDGQAAEFDKPDVLLKKGGLFKDLVDAWEQEHS